MINHVSYFIIKEFYSCSYKFDDDFWIPIIKPEFNYFDSQIINLDNLVDGPSQITDQLTWQTVDLSSGTNSTIQPATQLNPIHEPVPIEYNSTQT